MSSSLHHAPRSDWYVHHWSGAGRWIIPGKGGAEGAQRAKGSRWLAQGVQLAVEEAGPWCAWAALDWQLHRCADL
eukprot:6456364-Amphidinium_carterae.2